MLREVRCPTCRRSTPWAGNPYRPFCSSRCKWADLGQWASEGYRIPGASAEGEGEGHEPEADDGPDAPPPHGHPPDRRR